MKIRRLLKSKNIKLTAKQYVINHRRKQILPTIINDVNSSETIVDEFTEIIVPPPENTIHLIEATIDQEIHIEENGVEFFGDEETRDRYLVASFAANNGISFNGAESLSETLFELNKLCSALKRNTIIRSTTELAVLGDILFGMILQNSEELGIGFDEASKSDGRCHLEVEIFGKFKNLNNWFCQRLVIFFFFFHIFF